MNRPAWNRLEPWDRLERRRLTRRALLSRSARLGLGAAGLALVGCGGGDDDEEERSAATTAPAPVEEEPAAVTQAEPEQEQEQEPEPAPAPEPEPQPQPEAEGMMAAEVIIESLRLDGLDGAVTLRNMSPDPVDLSGWWFCQRPNYWPFPDIVLQPGQRLLINAGPGDNTADTFFGNGAFGSLSGSGGELALYRSGGFSNSDEIVSFVAWNFGGDGRGSVARGAGIWGEDTVPATAGDTISYVGDVGDGSGADAYAVQ